MSNLFRNKTIKFERKVLSDKKSINYDVIGIKHKSVMESFKQKQLTLPLLYKQVETIEEEIQLFETEDGISFMKNNLNDTFDQLTYEKSQYDILDGSILTLTNNKTVKKAKKASKKNMVVENGNEDQIEVDLLNVKLHEIEMKLKMLERVFTRKSYTRELLKKRDRIKEEIVDIEENNEELEYFSMNIEILDKFYTAPKTDKNENIEISVLDFFDRPQTINNSEIERQELIESYLQTMNGQRRHKKVNLGRICSKCKVPKILNNQEGTFTCTICSEVEFVLMDPDKPSYNAGTEQKNNTYRRINHCTEILNQSQGKESTEIDDDLIRDILEELNIRNILDLSTITKDDIKSVLKSIGMSSKSEHATHIANKLNGIPVRTIPYHLIEIVKVMWKMIEEAWVKIKDPDRKNFMNSSFLFHKIFELLEEFEEAEKWPYLANDKLRKYDVDWEKICEFWAWDFIRSV